MKKGSIHLEMIIGFTIILSSILFSIFMVSYSSSKLNYDNKIKIKEEVLSLLSTPILEFYFFIPSSVQTQNSLSISFPNANNFENLIFFCRTDETNLECSYSPENKEVSFNMLEAGKPVHIFVFEKKEDLFSKKNDLSELTADSEYLIGVREHSLFNTERIKKFKEIYSSNYDFVKGKIYSNKDFNFGISVRYEDYTEEASIKNENEDEVFSYTNFARFFDDRGNIMDGKIEVRIW